MSDDELYVIENTSTRKPRQKFRKKKHESNPLVRLSKILAWSLRHGVEELGLHMHPSGYVLVDELLSKKQFKGIKIEEIEEVVHKNDKKRFNLAMGEDGKKYIRANQGHTVSCVNDEDLLTRIEDPSEIDKCIHGTYEQYWQQILEKGLCRMSRNHIHFAPGEHEGEGVKSGMRQTANVKIYIDVTRAMRDGIKFYRSSNNVILSPGIGEEGVISSKYFSRVVKKGGTVLLDKSSQ
jgi:2'-phosphotransferase